MKTIALGTTLALALVASASAAAPDAAPPRYGQLVAGSPTQIPLKKEPAAIGGREKAPGIFPEKSDQGYGPNIRATEIAELPATDLPAEGSRDAVLVQLFANTNTNNGISLSVGSGRRSGALQPDQLPE